MTSDGLTRDELEALLRWYVEMGVDVAVDPVPRDRFAESAVAREAKPEPAPPMAPVRRAPAKMGAPAPPPAVTAAALSADAAVRSARDLAEAAATLDELRAALQRFDGCGLSATATRLAFADGNPDGRVMIVGKAPDADDDRQGRPFSGRPGQLLDRMLAAIGLDRAGVYIANLVPWRPPGNRAPTPHELAICRPFIARQIALAGPDVLVCLGEVAAESLLGTRESIMRLRGRWHGYDTGERIIRALPMLHPDMLLSHAIHKRSAWADLLALRKALDAP